MNRNIPRRTWNLIAVLAGLWFGVDVYGQDENRVDDQLLPTGRSISPAGKSLEFSGRPVDLAIGENGKLLFVKDRNHLRIFLTGQFQEVHSVSLPGGASLFGICVGKESTVYVTNASNAVHCFSPKANVTESDPTKVAKSYSLAKSITLPVNCFPCGLAMHGDKLFVAMSKKNQVAVVDLKTDKVANAIDVGVAPFDVKVFGNGKSLIVSNIGGRRAVTNDKTAKSAGTDTVVDKRGVASTGSVSIVDVATSKSTKEIPVGLHPSVVAVSDKLGFAVVCNTNHDTITKIVLGDFSSQTFNIKPDRKLPFGSMPSAVLIDDVTKRLYVANAGNNCISIFDIDPENATVKNVLPQLGLVPTGWYPAAIAKTDTSLFVANIKGIGARTIRRDPAKGRNSHDHRGTVQQIELAGLSDQASLADFTRSVQSNSKLPQILRSNELTQNPSAKPVPIPKMLGEPSLFKHVIYVIKENRTFDQVFGDIKGARAEPALCVFPEKITPNHHALAKRFGVLDNYYCNGVLSADGHSWATEGNVTPYLERAFGGFARSYTFGDDPITYSSSGFIWDKILGAGLSFRNYGELDYAKPPTGMKYQEIWKAYSEGKPIEFSQTIGISRLKDYSCRDYPGWNMVIPDVLRMDRFLKEFREFEKDETLPNFSIVYLPQDHLGGGVTSQAHMADNDLALGRLVDAVSKSKFWKETLIIVNEDDPQNGYDHIDGHRSICLVISPYSKPGINHQFYNQTSALRTMLHVFGLTPMNQQDSSAPLMSGCFQATGDFSPYNAIAANVPLNETQRPKANQNASERRWREILATVPIERTGMKTEKDEDNLNRFVWHEMKGWETPYPVQLAGPHGKGLKELKLIISEEDDD